jgi:sensor histidine kinase YesM
MKTNTISFTGSTGNNENVPANFMKDVLTRTYRKRTYWICQLAGWLLYASLNVIAMFSFDLFSWKKTIIFLFLCFAGISFTHVLRSLINKYSWTDLPLKKIIPRVLTSSIVTGIILFILYFGADILVGIIGLSKINAGSALVWVSNLSSVILLWSLIYFSVHFFENYKRVEIESLIWEAAVKDFELKTLKSQLNPHFMFNAMNSIRALIEEDPENAKTALTKLSNILRYSLKIERNETVPLEEEMDTVADYLALEGIRFEERLNYSIDVDPRSKKIEIPPLMIQTLVENGIKHGVSKMTEGGKITVTSKLNGSFLILQIKNSGNIDVDSLRYSKGFGIDNTKQRLNLIYGGNAQFTIQNELPNEVLAEIKIPTGGKTYESNNN